MDRTLCELNNVLGRYWDIEAASFHSCVLQSLFLVYLAACRHLAACSSRKRRGRWLSHSKSSIGKLRFLADSAALPNRSEDIGILLIVNSMQGAQAYPIIDVHSAANLQRIANEGTANITFVSVT